MANTHENLRDLFGDIADSIRSKNNSTLTIVADEFDTAIDALNTGIGATAAAGNILSGKTAVVNNTVITGNMSNVGTVTATITTQGGSYTIPAGYHSGSGKVTANINSGALSAADSTLTVSSSTITPSLAYNSSTGVYDYSGSATATSTAQAKVTTAGYLDSSKNTSKTSTATITASGTVAKAAIKSTHSGTTSAVTPVISKNAISISGVTDAASGSATTTAPTTGVYVAVQSAKNTGTLTSTPAFTSATAQYTDGTNYSATTASSIVGANASSVTYVPIKTGSASVSATTITKNPTISWDSTNNKIKATYSGSQSVTPSVSAGWVASGTAGTISTTGTTSIDPESLDSDLKAANIKDGVTIFDVTGTFSDSGTVSSGQTAASTANLLTGKSAFLDGAELKGSMTNNGAVTNTITTQGGSYTIPAGYHNGSGKVTASIAATTLDNSIISGEAVEESTGDYGWKTTVAVPAGYHNTQTLTKTFSEIFPAPETPATATQMLAGYQAYNKSGVLMTGTMANNGATGGTISSQGGTYTIPAGYTSGGTVTANINAGVITSGSGSASVSDPAYDSTNDDFDMTVSGTVAAPSVGTAGYVSSTTGTKNTNTVSGSKTLAKIKGNTGITGTTTVTPSISKTSVPSGVTDAASGSATTTAPTVGVYVAIQSAKNTGTLTAKPTVTTAGYGTSSQHGITSATATVGANASSVTYVPITTTTATVNGKTVSYGSGWIAAGSKSVADGSVSVSASGTANKPTIAKTSTTASGATNVGVTTSTTAPTSGYFVSNQATAPSTTITVTPIHTDGYITDVTNNGGTMAAKTGDVYYTTLATGALTASGSVTTSGSGSVNPGTNTISQNSATNVSVGTVTTTKPSSGYYVAVDASTAQNTGSVSVSGTGTANATVSTAGYVTTSQNATGSVSGSGSASVTVPAKSASTTYVPITSGSVSVSDKTLTVSTSFTPSLSTWARGGSLTLGTVTTSTPSGVVYVRTHAGTAVKTATVTGESSTVTKTAGYIASGTETITSSATATANATSEDKFYQVSAVQVPKDYPFEVEVMSDTAYDDTSTLTITNHAYRKVSVANEGTVNVTNNSGSVANITNSGTTNVTNSVAAYVTTGSSSSGLTYVNAYNNATTPTLTGNQAVTNQGKWVYNTVTPSTSAQGPFYGATNVSAMTTGSASVTGKTFTVTPTITVSGTTATISASGSTTVAGSVSKAGYISSVSSATVSASGSITIPAVAATTYNTSTSDQTISSGSYLAGTQTIKSVTTQNIDAANIRANVVIKVGDANNAGRIKEVTGSYTTDADAIASNIYKGKTAYVNGEKVTGTAEVTTTLNSGSDYTLVMPTGFITVS